MWTVKPMEVMQNGVKLGRYRLCAFETEGEFFAEENHPDHDTAQEAVDCDICHDYCNMMAGIVDEPEQLSLAWRKKPVVIEAFQVTKERRFDNADWPQWLHEAWNKEVEEEGCLFVGDHSDVPDLDNFLCIRTLEGVHTVGWDDYIIQGIKGELYPCKPDIFEATYENAVGDNDFGWALQQLKAGNKVARRGWNGKNQFVVMMSALSLPPFNTQGTARKVNDRTAKWIGEDTPLESQPYCALFNAQGLWQPGWLPSQGDLFSSDWVTV